MTSRTGTSPTTTEQSRTDRPRPAAHPGRGPQRRKPREVQLPEHLPARMLNELKGSR